MAGEQQFTPEAAKAVVGVMAHPETAVTGTTTADKILEAARSRYQVGQSEASLEVIARKTLPHKKEDVDRVALWNLSSARDLTTQEKTNPTNTDESRRFDESKSEDEAVRSLVEEGTIDAAFRTKITTFLETNSPIVGKVIEEMRASGGNVDNFVDGLMKMPGFKKLAMEFHTARWDPTKRLTQEAAVQNLELEIAKLSAQLGTEVTQIQIDAAETELDNANTALTPKTAELIKIKSKTDKLKDLEDEMKTTKEMFNKNKGVGGALEAQKNDLLLRRGGLDATTQQDQIDIIDQQIKKIDATPAYANYIKAQADIAEYNALPAEIAALQITVEPLQKQIIKKQNALDALLEKQKTNNTPQKKAEIEAQIKQKQGQLADAKTLLEAEQMKFYREVTHIGEDAMEKFITDSLNGVKTIWKEEATKQAEKDKTDQGKTAALAIEKAQNHLWKTAKTKGKLTFYTPDKNKAQTILNEAFKAGGGENIAVYLETKTPVELGITVDEHVALKEKLKDPEFRKVQSEGIAKQALCDYLIAGGRLNGDLVKSLATTEFGRGLLSEARTKADEAIQKYKDQFGKGVLDKGTKFAEFLKKSWWMWGIGILALIIFLTMNK
ncbi:MAG: hypothetical protein US38_C0001G0019 [Candidatus Roizmanbacteria bacterium GW2011_GWC1_37_12]|nr:MAG: hypothetical protein US38_C0001G0019 [Candidatus Roizmanbacteria bacterium GW2011_GWC1_37_12]